jgi:hypothetical protein
MLLHCARLGARAARGQAAEALWWASGGGGGGSGARAPLHTTPGAARAAEPVLADDPLQARWAGVRGWAGGHGGGAARGRPPHAAGRAPALAQPPTAPPPRPASPPQAALAQQLEGFRQAGTFKVERVITTPQGPSVGEGGVGAGEERTGGPSCRGVASCTGRPPAERVPRCRPAAGVANTPKEVLNFW